MNTSVCGGLMGGLAKNRGIRAMIVDGAGRDTDELEDNGWPIWTRAITPHGTHTMFSGRKEELSINVPIQCGGVLVRPGDFVVADLMGVTVIPLENAEKVLAEAREQAEREEKKRTPREPMLSPFCRQAASYAIRGWLVRQAAWELGGHQLPFNRKSSPAPEAPPENRIAPNAKQRLAPF